MGYFVFTDEKHKRIFGPYSTKEEAVASGFLAVGNSIGIRIFYFPTNDLGAAVQLAKQQDALANQTKDVFAKRPVPQMTKRIRQPSELDWPEDGEDDLIEASRPTRRRAFDFGD